MTLAPRAEEIRMHRDEFRLLRDLVNGYAGIYFGDEALLVLERRLRERVMALGLKSFGEYYQFLRFANPNSNELDDAVELLTTNETYFFREDYQLRALRDEVFPILLGEAASRKRLAVWSAGCSTGEEAYTLAVLLHESNMFVDWDVRVYGSDVSRKCVAFARQGIYGPSAFRVASSNFKRAYFVEKPDGSHVNDRIRAMCHFGHLNLLDPEKVRLVGRVDVIFCRNVLIYFDARSRKKVIEMFYERLVPGGFLFLGHSESLLNVSTAFELVHLSEDLVYRKPLLSLPVRRGGVV